MSHFLESRIFIKQSFDCFIWIMMIADSKTQIDLSFGSRTLLLANNIGLIQL